ncbi:MAG TPA: hypothetical protein VLI06_12180 [Solimonas sp.]|nr:hypothetical protein [Solimonas sp.]
MRPRPVFRPPSAEGFLIDGLLLPWGSTIADLREALAARDLLCEGHYGDVPCGRCQEACGFAAIAVGCEPADENRPVRVLTWQLAPYDPALAIADPQWWADAISAVLGAPLELQEADAEERADAGEGTVMYYARWEAGAFGIGLSVFGGQRAEATGVSAAYLYLSWLDTAAAARPYLAQLQQREQLLAVIAGESPEWKSYRLQQEQYAICAEEDAATRQLERALGSGKHCDTPAAWARRLDDRQVAFWRRRDGSAWGLSTRNDTVFHERGDSAVEVHWINRPPNRFGGQMELDVGALHLQDVHSSPALTEIAGSIGQCLGRRIECTVSEDSG